MSILVITPGSVSLTDWRAVYRGATPTLDPSSRPAIEASAAAVARIVEKGEPVYGINTGFGKLASVRIEAADLKTLQRNIVLSHAAGVGEPMPIPVARLMMALKLASLGQGASGVQPATLDRLGLMLEKEIIPVVPVQGSVGASGDLAPLAHMTAAMIGVGEVFAGGKRMEVGAALAAAGLAPLELGAKEGLALLNGTQFSTAYALAALFEVDTLFASALVTGALSTDAARGSDAPFDPRIHALRKHSGQIETADALRALMAGSAIRASHLVGDERVQDPYCLQLPAAGDGRVPRSCCGKPRPTLLGTEADGVSDNPLIFAGGPTSALSGGNFHAEPVAFAADMIALAVCEIGSLAERRIAMLVDPGFVRPARIPHAEAGAELRLHDPAGHGGRARLGEQAAGHTRRVLIPFPTSANQEDHVSMAAHGARRLLPMVENAMRGDRHRVAGRRAGLRLPRARSQSSPALEAVRRAASAGSRAPSGSKTAISTPDIQAAIALVRSGRDRQCGRRRGASFHRGSVMA